MTLGRRARRILVFCMGVTVPVLLFANVLQGMRYTRLERSVRELEQEQITWFEKNKGLLATIGIYSSPRRLQALVDPAKKGGEATFRVRVEGGAAASGEGTDGQ